MKLVRLCLNETYSRARVVNLSDTFPTHNGLKQGDALSPLLFQLCFRLCNKEGPRKSGRIVIELNTSAPGLC
jgi:hypothetical protein